MTAQVGRFPRLRRGVLAIPLVGRFLRATANAYRLRVRPVVRTRRRRLREQWIDFRNAHTRSAANVTRRNTRRAYDKLFAADDLLAEYLDPTRLAFYEAVADACADLRPRSVVDVGCGSGHLLRALAERLEEPVDLVGVDFSPKAIERAREVLPAARWVVADLRRLDLGQKFDLVLCTEVLEHVRDADAAIAALARLRARTGHVVATVPDGANDTWEGHVNFWDEATFARHLEPIGRAEIRRLENGEVLLARVPAH